MPEDSNTTRMTAGDDASSPASRKDSSVLEAIWDDEDTRAFYECLPDLRYCFNPATLQQALYMFFPLLEWMLIVVSCSKIC